MKLKRPQLTEKYRVGGPSGWGPQQPGGRPLGTVPSPLPPQAVVDGLYADLKKAAAARG